MEGCWAPWEWRTVLCLHAVEGGSRPLGRMGGELSGVNWKCHFLKSSEGFLRYSSWFEERWRGAAELVVLEWPDRPGHWTSKWWPLGKFWRQEALSHFLDYVSPRMFFSFTNPKEIKTDLGLSSFRKINGGFFFVVVCLFICLFYVFKSKCILFTSPKSGLPFPSIQPMTPPLSQGMIAKTECRRIASHLCLHLPQHNIVDCPFAKHFFQGSPIKKI